MVKWVYKGIVVDSIEKVPEGAIGFIYKISNTTNGRYYFGRKSIVGRRKKKLTLKEKLIPENKRKTWKVEVKEVSGWKTYKGSNKPLLADIGKGDKYTKEIVCWCYSKAELTYYETVHIVCSGCMITDDCYNDWFSAKVFKAHLKNKKLA